MAKVQNNTVLHLAAHNGHLLCLKHIVENGGNLTEKNNSKQTCLHMAACNGQLEAVKYLLKKDMSLIDKKDSNGHTALHMAACNGHADVVQYLLLKAASVSLEDNDGNTALVLAKEAGHDHIADLISKAGQFFSIPRHDILFPKKKGQDIDNHHTSENKLITSKNSFSPKGF